MLAIKLLSFFLTCPYLDCACVRLDCLSERLFRYIGGGGGGGSKEGGGDGGGSD